MVMHLEEEEGMNSKGSNSSRKVIVFWRFLLFYIYLSCRLVLALYICLDSEDQSLTDSEGDRVRKLNAQIVFQGCLKFLSRFSQEFIPIGVRA